MASFTVALKSWVTSTFPTKANNLSDLANAATARANLGIPGLYVRFLDTNGDPLAAGSTVTITVNTATGDIDDITYQEA